MKWPITLALICILFLTGCWDQKELNQVAVVMGIGLDKAGENQYRVTAQVIKPSPPGKGGGTGGSELPTWSLSANGKTVMDAIQRLNQISPRRLYWPHLQIIVFGQDLAKEGVKSVLTWFERDRDARSGTYVVVTKGKAEDLLNKKIELSNVPTRAMSEFLNTASLRQIPARRLKMRDFSSILAKPGIDPSLDVLDPKMIRGKIETYQLSGLAIFHDDKLKGFIDLPYTIGPAIKYNRFTNTILTIPMHDEENQYVSYQVTDFNQRLKTVINGKQITIQMKIFVEGNLQDQTGGLDVSYSDVRKKIVEGIKKEIQDDIVKSAQQAANLGCDIYGIGEEVRRHYPKFWRENINQWYTLLKGVNFSIDVDAHIRRAGLLYQPTPNKIK